VYQVLDKTTISPSAFQQEEFKLISDAGKNACKVRGLSRNATSQPQLHRSVTAPPLVQKHHIIMETDEGVPPSPSSSRQLPAESLV
jgi:hypothetical protein